MALTTLNPGDTLTATHINDNLRDLKQVAACTARANNTQIISAQVTSVMLLQTEDFDTDGMHSTVTNTGLFTPAQAGWYFLCGFIGLTATGSSAVQAICQATVAKNGASDFSNTNSGYGYARQHFITNTQGNFFTIESIPVFLNGTTDNLSVQVYSGATTTRGMGDGAIGVWRIRG